MSTRPEHRARACFIRARLQEILHNNYYLTGTYP